MAVEAIRVIDGVAPPRLLAHHTFDAAALADFDNGVTLVPAPGDGKAVVIESVVVHYEPGAGPTAFTGGGTNIDLSAGSSRVVRITVSSTGITGTTALTRFVNLAAGGVTLTPGAAIEAQTTAAFAAGDGTLTISIIYHVAEVS